MAAEWFTASSDICYALLTYGTGTAPNNGASATGTTVGNPLRSQVNEYNDLPVLGYITGLTPGTPYWFDLQVKSGSGGNCFFGAVNLEALEQ